MTTVLDRILARSLGASKASAPPARQPGRLRANVSYERAALPNLTTAEKQENLYANLTWMQIAIGAVANTLATTAFEVQERKGSELRKLPSHPFLDLLAQPNPDQSDFDLIEATYSWRAITGNCYWWLNRPSQDAPPDEIWLVPSHQIEPIPDGNMGVKGYKYDPGDGITIPLETWEICHFRTFNPLSRYSGLSATQALALDAIGDLAAQKFNTSFYAQDNAKMDGILAFSDNIEEGRWNRLKADWAEQHGGKQQKRMAMLRNVGAGGVQWIATQLSRVEIQYLEQRTFTREEVYAVLAPGLASILAVNATEANSTAGKDTFLTMGVYPQGVSLAKKITTKVLTSYGEGLVGMFEDVRRVDTQIELLEQQAYERTHTVDETRQKYYQDKVLGDPRGTLLPAEVGKGLTDARKPEDKPPPPQFGAGQGQPPDMGQSAPPDQALIQAGKALDRRRIREKAIKAIAAGRSPDVPFTPDYLDDGELMTIRAALKRAGTADDVWRAVEG